VGENPSSTIYRTVDDLCRMIDEKAESGNLSTALDLIATFVDDINSRETSLARVFSSPQLDRACLKLGRYLRVGKAVDRNSDQAVFLVTALYSNGGHSRVLLDLARCDPCKKINVLITNLHHEYPEAQIKSILRSIGVDPGITFEVAPSGSAASRLRWLQQRLSELRPIRTYLLQHHQDSLCIAAARPELAGNLFYVHHCDHGLALGVHIPHAVHVDLGAKGLHSCRENEGVRGNVLWPLSASVPNHRVNKPFLVNGCLKTSTSGSINKFDTSNLKDHIPYSITYPEMVVLILQEGGGTHLHIGRLSEPMRERIKDRLDETGIPQDRFIYVPFVPNLAEALLEHQVDAYIGSFPQGGGRATVEAMGAGMPLIIHSNYRSVFLSSNNEAYDGAMIWRTPAELANHLHQLTEQKLRRHAEKARAYFEKTHLPEGLCKAMKATFEGAAQEVPPRAIHHPDMLQAFLDEQFALTSRDTLAGRNNAEVDKLRSDLRRWVAEEEQLSANLHNRTAEAEQLRVILGQRTGENEILRAQLQQQMAEVERVRIELDRRTAEAEEASANLEKVYKSRSWRVTAPLRHYLHGVAKLIKMP
jgi:hypothetical protein